VKIKKSTTAWICSTLGVIGGGIGSSFYAAQSVSTSCMTALQSYITGLLAGSFTIPSFPINVTALMPNMTVPVAVFGNRMNLSIPGGQELHFISRIPEMSMPISQLLGKSAASTVQMLPEDMSGYCYEGTLVTGLICTGIAASILGSLAYTYESNARLRAELAPSHELENIDQNTIQMRAMPRA